MFITRNHKHTMLTTHNIRHISQGKKREDAGIYFAAGTGESTSLISGMNYKKIRQGSKLYKARQSSMIILKQ